MPASSSTSLPLDSAPVSNQPPNNTLPPPNRPTPNRLKLTYDIVMIIAISIDLLLISIDAILMSSFSSNAAGWLSISDALNWYQNTLHEPLRTAGGFFTLFLIFELLLRWAIAIEQNVYYRWFFFLLSIGMKYWGAFRSCVPYVYSERSSLGDAYTSLVTKCCRSHGSIGLGSISTYY